MILICFPKNEGGLAIVHMYIDYLDILFYEMIIQKPFLICWVAFLYWFEGIRNILWRKILSLYFLKYSFIYFEREYVYVRRGGARTEGERKDLF